MTQANPLNHLWQSTLFAVVAGLLALALRKNRAPVRYWLWFAASCKFLVPFALLVMIGSQLEWRAAPRPLSSVPFLMDQMSQPFAPPAPAPLFAHKPPAPIDTSTVLLCVWLCGFSVVVFAWIRQWWRVRAILRSASPPDLNVPIRAMSSPARLEPGVFGIFRPVLLLPEGITDRLTPVQWQAILAHELCHLRRRDNLTAAIHMAVEAIFWFHPLIWWIGKRLVDERERACDEEVLLAAGDPQEYAEGILNVCKFYLESPLRCVSGVTGSNLKKRIRAIMTERVATDLNFAKKLALGVAATAAIVVPIGIGILNAPTIQAQNAPANTPKFEVASIRACKDPTNTSASGVHSSPGRLATDCNELLNLIGNAYNGFADGHPNFNAEPTPITGGPPWLQSASYEINAKAEGTPSVAMMLGPMMQALLEDRFQLKIHRETREGPVYFLTVARGGPKLHSFIEGSCTPWSVPPPPLQPDTKYCGSMISGISPSVEALGATLDEFSKMLRVVVGRPVIDKTGITGRFNFLVKFSREGTELAAIHLKGPAPASDPAGPPSIFTAIQEQLGLRLASGKGPVDTLIIDHIERPSEN